MKFAKVLAVGLLLVAAQVSGQTLYGTIGAGGTPSSLIQLDPATGAQTGTVGSVGYAVNGMAWDATTSTLYATTSHHDSTFPDGLITIDLATGAGTQVGTGTGQRVTLPTCNSAGTMYGWVNSSTGDDVLVLWDKAAGTISVVGGSGTNFGSHGLDFAPNGTLYLVDYGSGGNANIYSIDTTTGLPAMVGQVGPLAYSMAHHGKFNPADGYYYGIDRTPEYDNAGWQLVVIDIAAQTIVRTMSTVDNLHTLAFVDQAAPTPVAGIPTLSRTGLIAMLVLLIGTALFIVRRRL